MKFFLKKFSELTAKDFKSHQIWAIYYEPDDIISLVELGYKLDDIQNELKSINYSDEYAFPIPNSASNIPFQYMYYAINAQSASGKIFNGYCCSRACVISLFFNDERYLFNLNLKDMAFEEEKKLKKALSITNSLFPIQIEVLPLNQRGIFKFD